MNLLSKLFGSNEREIKKLQPLVEEINALEDQTRRLSDEQIREKTAEFKERIKNGEKLDELLPEAFALVREAARRTIGERHFDVQLLGGTVLHQGKIAEMKTGEGKTLAATLPVYLNALGGKGVHVVTVNDYLAKRDCNWMGAIYHALGISTACIVHDAAYLYEPKIVDADQVSIEEENLKPVSRREAYEADVTYGTNNEFGFDYLRDNMAPALEYIVQREPNYAIVDEVDSILIDEARTPLIISAPDAESEKLYIKFAQMVPRLARDKDYTVDEKDKTVSITDDGIAKVEQALGVGNIYEQGKISYVHHLEQALKAQVLFQRDRDYVVRDGQVIIVDDFTGRLMEGRRYSEGLHQAIEAKEGVAVQRESKTLATITFQNYFRMYKKLAGMTGTALTSAEEFAKVYKLDVAVIPTNEPMIRKDLSDMVYKTEKAKFDAISQYIKELHQKGQPVLVGTIAIEKSEYLSTLLSREGVKHEVLNAKHHEREAQIITKAGQKEAVTVATNMAGRGTDIKLGEGVKELGGLHIIGTERHEARRIDNQLRGRSGRQGDMGMSQFYVSLEDELMRRFGGERLKNMMETLGLPDDQPIQNKLISKSIENAQGKIEGYNFDIRKHVLDYDDVMNKQREAVYKKRRAILKSNGIKREILEDIKEELEITVSAHTVGESHDWKLDEIKKDVSQIFPLEDTVSVRVKEIKSDKSKDAKEKIGALIDYLFEYAKGKYNQKEKEIGEEQMRKIEKYLALRTIDMLWMNHLDEMDYLRGGIGLRGYGQRDPLVEYKRESYYLFSALVDAIRRNVVRTIYKVQIVAPAQEAQARRQLSYSGGEQIDQFGALRQAQPAETGGSASGQTQESSNPAFQRPIINKERVGRNEPCPCGAKHPDGRPIKYKHCHGK